MKCSVYIVCPSILSCSNLKLHQIAEVKNIYKQENIMLQLTFNPGLTLTGFQTTRPTSPLKLRKLAHFISIVIPGSLILLPHVYISVTHKCQFAVPKCYLNVCEQGAAFYITTIPIFQKHKRKVLSLVVSIADLLCATSQVRPGHQSMTKFL